MNMMINFTQDEMKKFILKNGQYQITTVKYIHTYKEYHNRIVEEERSVEIAYPSDIDIENFVAGKSDRGHFDKWSIQSVFGRELKNKLLNL